MTQPTLTSHIIEPKQPAQWCVIWLHGLGADGYDFVPIVDELGLPPNAAIRFVFPHAPQRPVSINHGMMMRAWYDIAFDGLNRRIDHAGVQQSVSSIESLIDEQVKLGMSYERIIVAGFSQGGAITLTLAAHYTKKIAGFIALSTYLPSVDSNNPISVINQTTPILMVHGTQDNVVPMSLGKQAAEYLTQQGFNLEWHHYVMGHSVCFEEIQLISQWLKTLIHTTGDRLESPQ